MKYVFLGTLQTACQYQAARQKKEGLGGFPTCQKLLMDETAKSPLIVSKL